MYSFRNAPPVLHLDPGRHRIDLRLVRDVRAFGGILEPTVDVVVGVEQVSGTLDLAKPGILMSDVIDGSLASPYGSISLRNSAAHSIEITGVHPANISANVSSRSPLMKLNTENQLLLAQNADDTTFKQIPDGNDDTFEIITVAAGQTRSLTLNITLPFSNASSVAYNITYKVLGSRKISSLEVTQDLRRVSVYDPHKVTFLHPGGIVSYAMLRPPAKNATCKHQQEKLPVLLALHGAGLEADNPLATGALDRISDICAWTIFPTGVTSWSGDDWHTWGLADVEAAVNAIPAWILHRNWPGPGVHTDRWIVSGHSNGGQGTWYMATHYPDKVLAAVPVSGYASIQKYVPYELWQPADPRRTSVLSATMNSYRHEMLMSNLRGIPIQQQHGEFDDNVPAYHSRFLAQQIQLEGMKSSYNEVPGQKHWWDGVMATSELVAFYHKQARSQEKLPRELDEFSIVVGDPGDMGGKGGVKVTQLEDPGIYGRVHVRGRTVETSNVLSIHFGPPFWKDALIIDGQTLEFATIDTVKQQTRVRLTDGVWTVDDQGTTEASFSRKGRQLGSMAALLRTHGPLVVRQSSSASTSHLALQLSRNLHQYFRANSVILEDTAESTIANATGNAVYLVVGDALTATTSDFPIQVSAAGLTLRDYRGREQRYAEARGAAWLRPLGDERVELVVWGADDDGLRQAARLVPMLTGVGQPDFVVLSEQAKWKGIEGALALGFFDSQWQVTASSFVF